MTNNIDKQENIEVELRGPISNEDAKRVEEFLSQNGAFKISKWTAPHNLDNCQRDKTAG